MKSSSAFAWARGQFVSESGSIASARGSSNAASCGVSDAADAPPRFLLQRLPSALGQLAAQEGVHRPRAVVQREHAAVGRGDGVVGTDDGLRDGQLAPFGDVGNVEPGGVPHLLAKARAHHGCEGVQLVGLIGVHGDEAGQVHGEFLRRGSVSVRRRFSHDSPPLSSRVSGRLPADAQGAAVLAIRPCRFFQAGSGTLGFSDKHASRLAICATSG